MNKKDQESIQQFSTFLSNLSANELAIIGCLCGILLSESLNTNQQASLGNFLELIGQVLLVYNSQNILLNALDSNSSNSSSNNNCNSDISKIYELLQDLNRRLTRLEEDL